MSRRHRSVSITGAIGCIAFAVALVILVFNPAVAEGTAILVTAALTGSAWAFKTLVNEQETQSRILRNVSIGYLSAIGQCAADIRATLSDAELARHLTLAPAIREGREAASWRGLSLDRFAELPDLRDHLNVLSPEVIEQLVRWKLQTAELNHVYDLLGTREMAALSDDRLKAWARNTASYRDAYLDLCEKTMALVRAEGGLK